ncbi:hypothetical protein JCM8547_002345 [Rhodosporidiobolus lusitaniae]
MSQPAHLPPGQDAAPSASLASLPPELLDKTYKSAFPMNEYVAPSLDESCAVALAARQSGRLLVCSLRARLFSHVYLNFASRTTSLLGSLLLDLPGNPLYFRPFVTSLTLSFGPRPLSSVHDRTGDTAGEAGITPIQVRRLAAYLPHLSFLHLVTSEHGGWLGSPSMMEALQVFNEVANLTLASSFGWNNAVAVTIDKKKLEGLSLVNPEAGCTLARLLLFDCTVDQQAFADLLTGISGVPASPLFGTQPTAPPALRDLAIVRLRTRDYSLSHPTPFNYDVIRRCLYGLFHTLHSFTLELAEPDARGIAFLSPLLNRPGDLLAHEVGPSLVHLSLGGAFVLSSVFFSNLDHPQTSPGHLRSLTLFMCKRWPPSRRCRSSSLQMASADYGQSGSKSSRSGRWRVVGGTRTKFL